MTCQIQQQVNMELPRYKITIDNNMKNYMDYSNNKCHKKDNREEDQEL